MQINFILKSEKVAELKTQHIARSIKSLALLSDYLFKRLKDMISLQENLVRFVDQ